MKQVRQTMKDTGTEKEEGGMVMDLVCGMELELGKAKLLSDYKGKTYFFCSEGCKAHFDSDPEKYAE